MATFVHGKNAYIKLDSNSLQGVTNEITYSRKLDTAETTVFANTAKTYILGLEDSTVSIKGMFSATEVGQIETSIANVISNTSTSLALEFGPAGNGTGAKKYSMNVIPTSWEIGAPVGDVVHVTLELQRTGATTISTY